MSGTHLLWPTRGRCFSNFPLSFLHHQFSLLLDDFCNTEILSSLSHLKTKQNTPSLLSPFSFPDILHFSPLCTEELWYNLTYSNFSSPILSSLSCNKGFSLTITQITLIMLPDLIVSSCGLFHLSVTQLNSLSNFKYLFHLNYGIRYSFSFLPTI